ncbi:ABC transporter ATP-binding protein [Mucisphaera sp.]|uniref:ABC transporter ATP-binding protein n=1 Tax=Mucisphaera sp. TaxID=2913024 RepID=UPI003D0C6ED6
MSESRSEPVSAGLKEASSAPWMGPPTEVVGVTRTEGGHRIRRPGGEPLVRLVNVSKRFGSQHVLRNLSLDILEGQSTVIIGPSGTGKSVLIKHIVGLLTPDEGEVYYRGERVDQLDAAELVEVRKKIGFLFQMAALFDSLNVGDNVAFPLVEHTDLDKAERDERVDRVLRMVGLSGLQSQMPSELSGGQKKRVSLARSIVLEPEMVLYDEPTTGLDPIRSDLINELIVGLSTRLGITSVVVTHDMNSACKIADRMLLIYDGSIIHDGPPESFWKSDNELVKRFVHGQADAVDLALIQEGLDDTEEDERERSVSRDVASGI